jgi:alpha-amylase/alpha-mannosidase (GH57 family)
MNVVFVWHMHQPYYVDPLTKTAMMPWVRLHAVKGYLDMIDVAARYPDLRLTFNFTPVLVRQLEELAEGGVRDLWEDWSRKPAGELTDFEKARVLENFFKINWETIVRPHSRFDELLHLRGQSYDLTTLQEAVKRFTEQDYRDLQVWYNLGWCGFSAVRRYPELRALKEKGRGFTEEEKLRVLDIHREIVRSVLGLYREAQAEERIEITTTPYFHPIMPLVYNTDFAKRCMPGRTLPDTFGAPEDVRQHLLMAQEQHARVFGKKARGLWPSEGSVAPELLPLFAEAGIEYFCTDEEVLFRSLKLDPAWSSRPVDHLELFQGWEAEHDGVTVKCLFRERPLSDFIGFNAARNGAAEASDHMLHHLEHLSTVTAPGHGVCLIALDGENAWEAFHDGGEAFLCRLYEKILASPRLRTRTLAGYFDEFGARAKTSTLHTGSWIGGDFDIWIGDAEENRGWEAIGKTRDFLVRRAAEGGLTKEQLDEAWQEIYAAEGSDWFWWYGPDFQTDCDYLFDQLFRTHLQNVYRVLGGEPPQYLEVPIRTRGMPSTYTRPTSYIHPQLGGAHGFYDWLGAGHFDVRHVGSAMFQADRVVEELFYGFSEDHFHLIIGCKQQLPEELILYFHRPAAAKVILRRTKKGFASRIERSSDGVAFTDDGEGEIGCAAEGTRLQLRVPIGRLGWGEGGSSVAWMLQVLKEGVEVERYPDRGLIEFCGPSPEFEMEHWMV